MARDDIAVTGMQNTLVVTDSEFDRALDHKAKLLILMVVVGRLGVGLEVDKRHGDALPVDGPGGEPFGKQDRSQVAERLERFHPTTPSLTLAVPRPAPPPTASTPQSCSRT